MGQTKAQRAQNRPLDLLHRLRLPKNTKSKKPKEELPYEWSIFGGIRPKLSACYPNGVVITEGFGCTLERVDEKSGNPAQPTPPDNTHRKETPDPGIGDYHGRKSYEPDEPGHIYNTEQPSAFGPRYPVQNPNPYAVAGLLFPHSPESGLSRQQMLGEKTSTTNYWSTADVICPYPFSDPGIGDSSAASYHGW